MAGWAASEMSAPDPTYFDGTTAVYETKPHAVSVIWHLRRRPRAAVRSRTGAGITPECICEFTTPAWSGVIDDPGGWLNTWATCM
jgi:hypothetical protein